MNQVNKTKGIVVIKIGGSTLGSQDTTVEDLVKLQQAGTRPVVIHGGGNSVSEWLERFAIPVRFVRGLRVTDARTLKVVVAVLGGLVNKEIVASIQSLGGRAIGLTGVDGGLFQALVREPEMGYVGEVVGVNTDLLKSLLEARLIPVIAPIALQASRGKGDNVYMLNVNGDTVAGDIAAAVQADKLIFLTDVPGIKNGKGEILKSLTPEQAKGLLTGGVASGGMIPKVEGALRALSTVPVVRIIDGSSSHALINEMAGKAAGTTIA